jgi:quinol monooxygenase YgiN
MYGSLAFMRALPGRRPELTAYVGRYRKPDWGPSTSHVPVAQLSGMIVNYIYELDRDPDEALMLAVFDDRTAYERNAASPEQHERYLGYRALLESDPEWHDGEIMPFLSFGKEQPLTGMYGTVARIRPNPGVRAEIEALLAEWDEVVGPNVTGAIGTWLLWPDEDRDVAYFAGMFESERSYWDHAQSQEQTERYQDLRALLSADPEWHDGSIHAFQRF